MQPEFIFTESRDRWQRCLDMWHGRACMHAGVCFGSSPQRHSSDLTVLCVGNIWEHS